jgi:hypothetical protein
VTVPKFLDTQGRDWHLPKITTRMLNTLRDDHKFDLREALKPDMGALAEALNDDERVAALCWELCKDQAAKAGVDRDEWADEFDGPTYQNAVVALLSAVWTFSRGPEKAAKATAALRAVMGWDPSPTSSNSAGKPPEPPEGSTPAT